MGSILESSIIYDDIECLERINKEKEYYDYIKEHVRNVVAAFNRYFLPLLDKNNICKYVSDDDLKNAILIVKDRIEAHDASKYLDAEFNAYRAKYHPTANESKGDSDYIALVDDRYREACEHHYQNNRHHPEYWKDFKTGVSRDMELDAIVEMICDWEACSTMFGTNTLEWYETKAKDDEQKSMTQHTKDIVEDLLRNVLHN